MTIRKKKRKNRKKFGKILVRPTKKGPHSNLGKKFGKILKIWKNTWENSENTENLEKYSEKFGKILKIRKNTRKKRKNTENLEKYFEKFGKIV